ncbi:MAG: molybdopterin biosynthesis protein [Ruminococcaceae bacterium]|nr:molybdopterin biosynthesis protein [Oscillospiraceae bacterium]
MKHNYLDNIPLSEAKERFFSLVCHSLETLKAENVETFLSAGRVTKNALYAKICSPHYNASAMDGISVKARDTYGASENTPVVLSKEQYTVVDTGDPIPDNHDAVIMVEDISEDEKGNVTIYSAVHPWQNVRQVGEDICMGDMIAPSLTVVTPSLCGAILAGGITHFEAVKRPVLGIIPTGDEIVPPTENPGKGDIIEFNSSIFSSMVKEWGGESRVYPIVKDKKDLLEAAVKKGTEECDVLLILAGSSAGRDDYTCEIIKNLGTVCVHGIAVKPGKPAVLGKIGEVPVVGLPGYPVSAIVIMENIVRDLVYRMGGLAVPEKKKVKAVLGKRIVSSLKYHEFVRVTLGKVGESFTAVPLMRGAGVVTSFTKADGILEIPQDSEGAEQGEEVEITLLKSADEISTSLIVTGSHDPMIDEIKDIMKKRGYPFTLSSSHVGSMGAINAIKSKSAHLGGIHLLDTQSGEYNKSYVEKYFPDGSAKLYKGVGRIQGLMVRKGNPLDIKDFSDVTRCVYVNRQLGSGTRILCDYLIGKYGIDKAKLEGYRNEEFTHTAVAALIASGNADCGLGIYSAAKMYGLDFIPVSTEKYGFLVNVKAESDEAVRAFFEILESDELKERLTQMGGYSF